MKKVESVQFRLQYITHFNDQYGYLQGAALALQGGCRWVQLRMKDAPREAVEDMAYRVKDLCEQHNAIFIIDDHVDICRKVHADGVHLGKNDMSVFEAREKLGDDFIIGATCHSVEELAEAQHNWADYAGVGPFRFTATKKKLAETLGLEGYKRIAEECQNRGVTLPMVAIGGITADDICPIMRCGMDGIAVSGEILNAHSPAEKTQEIVTLLAKEPYV